LDIRGEAEIPDMNESDGDDGDREEEESSETPTQSDVLLERTTDD
jgi:hypothetical protein